MGSASAGSKGRWLNRGHRCWGRCAHVPLGDTTQLDATFAKVGAEVPAKMGAATAAVQGTTVAVQDMAKEMAIGTNGAVELGEITNLAGEKSRESIYQARGETQLLGEMFGVH